jgi:hypothetical protein
MMSALSPNIATRLAPHALTIAIVAFVVVFSAIQPAFLTPDNLVGIVARWRWSASWPPA